jgi:hypothetical protein
LRSGTDRLHDHVAAPIAWRGGVGRETERRRREWAREIGGCRTAGHSRLSVRIDERGRQCGLRRDHADHVIAGCERRDAKNTAIVGECGGVVDHLQAAGRVRPTQRQDGCPDKRLTGLIGQHAADRGELPHRDFHVAVAFAIGELERLKRTIWAELAVAAAHVSGLRRGDRVGGAGQAGEQKAAVGIGQRAARRARRRHGARRRRRHWANGSWPRSGDGDNRAGNGATPGVDDLAEDEAGGRWRWSLLRG